MPQTRSHHYLQIHPADNVLVALRDLPVGSTIQQVSRSFSLPFSVAAKHKFVTDTLAVGDEVIMYGVRVGKITQPVELGEPLTTFNLRHDTVHYGVGERAAYHWNAPPVDHWESRTFEGYYRSDGSVGTRNYWLVIPLVFCENRNIRVMQEAFEKELGFRRPTPYREQLRSLKQSYIAASASPEHVRLTSETLTENNPFFTHVDGVQFVTHEMGCGGTQEDAQRLCALLAGCIVNPNVTGVTVLSLGCQKSQIDDLWREIYQRCPTYDRPLLYFNQQDYGTESALLTSAISETFKGLVKINKLRREPAPLNKLRIGLKCGGSDGFSGLSANPALGHLSDIIVGLGGTTYLAEFPELCGVEQELINRCETVEDAEKFVLLMQDYARLAAAVGAGFDMNPSVGNIKDGLITDAIKSAGAAKKGGSAPISGVLNYTEVPRNPGLQLLCTPGNDVLATTGMAASGATLIVFTTGLGTPTGNPIAPTVKVSTNSRLARHMPDIIDFDAGSIIEGQQTIAETGEQLLETMIDIASGRIQTKAEKLGQYDFIPWQQGVNL